MKIAVFGATGSIGRPLVDQALDQGHAVVAVTRDRSRVELRHERLQVVEADPTDVDRITPALDGCDAVVIVIGSGLKGQVRGPSTGAIITAMQRAGVRRLICQSSLGVGDSRDNLTPIWKYLMFGLFLRGIYLDHQDQEAKVRASGLDWIIVRPTSFSDGPRTGEYRHGFGTDVKYAPKISRADVADFLLAQLDNDRYLHQAAAISY